MSLATVNILLTIISQGKDTKMLSGSDKFLPEKRHPTSSALMQTVLGCSLYGSIRILVANIAGLRVLLDTS